MIGEQFLASVKNKNIAFCGLGISNLPLIHFFSKYGANVIACDKREINSFSKDVIKELKNENAQLNLGKNYLKNLNVDIIFRTPGIPFFSPELNKARKKGIVVTSEMEVFFDLCPCKIIGITGSDGKTTTTTIISEMLKSTKKTIHLGGNIGRPLLFRVNKIDPEDIVVVELSSFQLISMRRSPDISIVTNIEPNHLDIHKNMSEYINAKKNIILHQSAFSKTVLNLDNKTAYKFSKFIRGEKLCFSRKKICKNGAFSSESGEIFFAKNKEIIKVMNEKDIALIGKHNLENYLASITALWGIVEPDEMKKVATKFQGIEHRIEFIREIKGVKYYNDSIASNPTRTIRGILSIFPTKIILIAGGYDKNLPYNTLGETIVRKVKTLILMGQTTNAIEDSVKNSEGYEKNNPKIIKVENMKKAVDFCRKNAKSGDIIALSPASASFDSYENFSERGKHFKKLVMSI
ncbi:MAG: UDP-N-acetylmuramoyl-L-alanine--D-glutamate ligase [Oscillospiraceae bacterium]|jgi:UDP-N-acetylmuramoylalanine--D-glutamate ligase|nr:UDP-N-acetylmuramoyl-L-alanine--D-glutamate ligase [Oscillospiraceae bacterium]